MNHFIHEYMTKSVYENKPWYIELYYKSYRELFSYIKVSIIL